MDLREEEFNYSIIIPHYNSIEKLRRLLNTIPNRKDIEVLVIDDKTLNFDEKSLLDINIENLRILKNSSRVKGAGVCRNIGLKESKGKWILFADADDYFLAEAFVIIDKYLDCEEDIVYFVPTSIYEDTKERADRHIYFEKLIFDFLKNKTQESEKELRFEFGVPWSKLIKANLIKKNQIEFDETIVINDRMFSLKTGYFSNKIIATKEKIYCVTRDKGSLTTIQSEKIFDIKISVLLNINKYILEIGEKRNRPYMIGYLLSSRIYGIKKFINTLNILLKNNCKIFPNNIFNYIQSGFVLKKILERKKDRKYWVK